MPPALPYPYSPNEDLSSPFSELSTENSISASALQSVNTNLTEKNQDTTVKECSNSHDQSSFSLVDDLSNSPGTKLEFPPQLLLDKDNQDTSSSKIEECFGIETGVHASLFNDSGFGIYEVPLTSALNSNARILALKDTSEDSAKLVPEKPLGLPRAVFARIVWLLDHDSLLHARATARLWLEACTENRPLQFSPVYQLPVELIQLILKLTSPTSFNAARHICRAWYLSSFEPSLLKLQLKTLGFYHADPTIQNSQSTRYLSTRLCREFSLGASGSSVCGLHKTVTIDMSDLAATTTVHFTVSICGSYALLSEGCVVYVYRLQARTGGCIEFVASVVCPRRVLAVSMDTSSRRFAIAILLVSFPLAHS